MSWPEPHAGLVIRYAYLWRREAQSGREEGVKDRPCAIVFAVGSSQQDSRIVWVLPVTHSPPNNSAHAIVIPAEVKRRLGLDAELSWIILDEFNIFTWPGPDLRPAVNGVPSSAAYGTLPPRFYAQMLARWLELYRSRRSAVVKRTE